MKTRIATVLAALAALVASHLPAAVTTNVFTNVTYKANITYSLVPVTNTTFVSYAERAGRQSYKCESMSSFPCKVIGNVSEIDTNKLDTTVSEVIFFVGQPAYTNISGVVGLLVNTAYASYSKSAWTVYDTLVPEVFVSDVLYTNRNDVAYISMTNLVSGGQAYSMVDDAAITMQALGTNGLYTVTNVATRLAWRPEQKVSQVLIPSVTNDVIKTVGTNIFVNGINVTR